MTTTVDDVKHQLLPLLRHQIRPEPGDVGAWTATLVEETRDLLRQLLPLTQEEQTFLCRLNDDGELEPERLTLSPDVGD